MGARLAAQPLEPATPLPVLWQVPPPPASRSLAVSPAGLAASLLVLLVAALCVRLGFWQLDRRAQRAELNARLESRLSQPVLSLDSPVRDTALLTFRRVHVAGTFDHERTLVMAGRSLHGSPGAHVLTPVRVDGAGAVLVNRGWLPAADAATVDLDALENPDRLDAQGLALPFPGSGRERSGGAVADSFRITWFAADEAMIREQFPYELMPIEVRLLPDQSAPRFPVRLDPPSLDPGPHLGYAIQWFSFAAIAIIGWIALARKGRRRATMVPALLLGLALTALPATGQLRPLDPLDWPRLENGDAFYTGLGAGLLLDQEASLAGTRGTLGELGNFVVAWKTGRVLVRVSGTLARSFEDDEVLEPPAPGVRAPDGSIRRDAGDVRAETTLRLLGRGQPALLALRFGTRLPTSSDEPGIGRDRTDFHALLGARYHAGRVALAGEAGVGILSTHHVSWLDQSDVLLFAAGIEVDAGPITPSLHLVGQDDLHRRRVRGNEDLSEVRLGLRTGGRWWLETIALHGLADYSPGIGVLVMTGLRW